MTEADFVTLFIIAVAFVAAAIPAYFALQWFVEWDFRRRERRDKVSEKANGRIAALEFGRSAGYSRALFGIEASNPYLLHPDMDREWHKGYRAGLIEGGKQLEHGPQITDMAGNPMPGYPWV